MHQKDDVNFCKKAKKRISKDHRDFDDAVKRIDRLLRIQFCPSNPVTPLREGSDFFRLTGNEQYSVWRINVAVVGLKDKRAWPRYWFGVDVENELIVPLEMGRHKDYGESENEIERSAIKTMEQYMKDSGI